MTSRLRGLAASIALLLLLVGVPVVLQQLGTAAIPQRIPDAGEVWDAVRRPDDGTLAMAGFTIAAWAAWLVMAFSIVTELACRARGVRAPALPGLAWPQDLARRLVGAAALVVLAVPASASAAPLPSAPAISTTTATAAPAVTMSPEPSAPAARHREPRSAHAHLEYHIQPGDTLWDIAQRHLGDGADFPQIVDLNRDVLDDDDPSLLTPGMVLHLPATYHVQAGDTLSAIAARELGHRDAFVEIADANDLRNPDVIEVGQVLTLPSGSTATPPSPSGSSATSPLPKGDKGKGPGATPREAPSRPRPVPVPHTTAPAPEVSLSWPAPAVAPGVSTPTPAPSSVTAEPMGDQAGISSRTLIGLTGGGGLLAASLLTILQRRRRRQFRSRRPGRTITSPDPVLAPVESTILRVGVTATAASAALDAALRELGHACIAGELPLPDIAAVSLGADGAISLHLAGGAPEAPSPWISDPHAGTWTRTDPPTVTRQELPAPWPLLATIGTSDDDTTWLLNLEGQTVLVAGDPTFAADWMRYVVADLGCSPWAEEVHITLVDDVAGTELAGLDPSRITLGATADTERVAHQSVTQLEELTLPDVSNARAALAGDSPWPARLLVLGTGLPALTEYLAQHPGATSTGILCRASDDATAQAPAGATTITVTVTAAGRALVHGAGLDVVAVGLTCDEAAGIAALLQSAAQVDDAPVPDLAQDRERPEGWRSFADSAGALRFAHTTPRDILTSPQEDNPPLLPQADEDYLQVAATTREDLARLAPTVPAEISSAVQHADPTLDADLAAWHDPATTRPRVALLGPVSATVAGTPPDGRLAYYCEVLAYLLLRPNGATAEEVADAFDLSIKRTHTVIGVLRSWVGEQHLPSARTSPAARARGGAVYQIVDGLTDLDLFRRLRLRAQARGNDGIPDLRAALALVTGPAFSQLRPGGWRWVLEGDRLDEHATVAVVDAAHIVVLDALSRQDTHTARQAAETARSAAPFEDVPSLDLAAITRAEGDLAAAQLLVDTLCAAAEDGIPDDLPPRTNTILDANPTWLTGEDLASRTQAG